MASNVFTKNEILQSLASKGFFVDAYTLDTFLEKWKIEAIFEDEQGTEFYDKNALDLVLDKLFNSSNEDIKEEEENQVRLIQPQAPTEAPIQQVQVQIQPQVQPQPTQIVYVQTQNTYEMPQQPVIKEVQQIYPQQQINDIETNNILNNIALSDGTPLAQKVQNNGIDEFNIDYNLLEQEAIKDINVPSEPIFDLGIKEEKKMGILEGAMLATGQEFNPETEEVNQEVQTDENPDFDDMSLLSESLEAQEKFREYVVSELSKKNLDLTPKGNEFKLDISERTLNMIARSMAKKIAQHVNKIFSGDIKSSEKLQEIEEKNKKLEQRAKELEDQNKKLRLLLAESNKNLNSYKPSMFGLYKKVPPGQ